VSSIELVVATSKNGVIGRNGELPWHIPSELKRFKQLTMGTPVIMGRRTWESLPRKPLPGRQNIVITRQGGYVAEGATVVASKAEALKAAGQEPRVMIIGGGEIYDLFIAEANVIHLTEVDLVADGDTFLPQLHPDRWEETSSETVAADPLTGTPGYTVRRLVLRP
jgi:dihydrofolate reductase